MEAQEHSCPTSELIIEEREILSYLGYGDRSPDEYVAGYISKLKAEALATCRPLYGYKHFSDIAINKSKKIEINGTSFEPGAIITHALKKSDSFILLLSTVGAELSDWIEEKRKGDLLEGFIADAIGSTFAEAIVARAKEHLKAQFTPQGLHISNSYSPGYCGWHVSEQQKLFSLLPEGLCKITLTPSSLMLPIKSVSSIIGVGQSIEYKDYGCAICNKKDCYKRRLK